MNWHWIMNARLNSLRLQGRLQAVAILSTQRIHMIDVPGPWHFGRRFHAAVREQFVVSLHDCASRLGPAFQMMQLYAQDRALKPFHAVIESAQHVMILAVLSPIAQPADRARILGIAGGQGTTLAI